MSDVFVEHEEMTKRGQPPARKRRIDVEVHQYEPWWMTILKTQGIGTVFALILLIGGGRMAESIASKHMQFIDVNMRQVEVQTESLGEIAKSNRRQEDLLQEIRNEASKEASQRRLEHKATIDGIDYFKGKKVNPSE